MKTRKQRMLEAAAEGARRYGTLKNVDESGADEIGNGVGGTFDPGACPKCHQSEMGAFSKGRPSADTLTVECADPHCRNQWVIKDKPMGSR